MLFILSIYFWRVYCVATELMRKQFVKKWGILQKKFSIQISATFDTKLCVIEQLCLPKITLWELFICSTKRTRHISHRLKCFFRFLQFEERMQMVNKCEYIMTQSNHYNWTIIRLYINHVFSACVTMNCR